MYTDDVYEEMVLVQVNALIIISHDHLNQKDENEIPVDYQNHLLDDRVDHFHQELIFECLKILNK